MKKLIAIILLLSVCSSSLAAEQVKLQPNYPSQYTVKTGDTLWDIAHIFLQDPWQWPQIWQINPKVKNPHLIYPGDVLALKMINAKPQLQVIDKGTIKLSPKVRSTANRGAISTIKLSSIKAHLTKSRLIEEATYNNSPYVVANGNDRLVSGNHDLIYVRGLSASNNTNYTIIRKEDEYKDPKTKKVLGYEARYISRVKLVHAGDPSIFETNQSETSIKKGDRLTPTINLYDKDFYPHAPTKPVSAQIIETVGGINRIGLYDIVVLNLGSDQGVNNGTVLRVFRDLDDVNDKISGEMVKLPNLPVGLVMVFQTYNKLSYALVMDAKRTIQIGDQVTNP